MDTEAKFTLFCDMVGCCHDLYMWTYDSAFHLISSNCPQQNIVNNLLMLCRQQEMFDGQIAADRTPIILTNDMGLMWVVAPCFEGDELLRLYVLGPFFIDDIPQKNLEAHVSQHDLSPSLRYEFRQFLLRLPIISLSRVFEYSIMLHFCLTGEKITVSDLRFHKSKPSKDRAITQQEPANTHGTYAGEQEMLRLVREGDMEHFRTHMDRMSVTGRVGKLSNGGPVRQVKNSLLVCITLFSRAAIEGGLSPEVSYTLADQYFQSIEACKSLQELAEIAYPMQEDFVRRVYRCRTSNLSQPIRDCCEYISLHLEDKLTLPELAQQTGYTEYYLSKKFKREVKMSPSEYIRQKRLERAALLLRTTQDDVHDISIRLQFCSQSYFADHFRKFFGVSPSAYRQGKFD